MFIQRTKRVNAEIDMTPLIDVVFQLLIFLMVSSQFTKPEEKVNLPTGTAATETIKKSKKTHTLTITADHQVFLGEIPIQVGNISEKLSTLIAQLQIKSLEIRGDKTSELGIFIEIIETAKSSGVVDLSYHKKTPLTSE